MDATRNNRPAFGALTLNGLYALHHQLVIEHTAAHERMMDGTKPIIPVFSEKWNILSAKQAEISETMEAVYAEIGRREAEREQAEDYGANGDSRPAGPVASDA